FPKHILVIDDDQSVRNSLALLLRAYGLHVSLAPNGENGIAQALKLRPDIVLVDLGLLGLNGLETAARIRAKLGKSIYLIALSGYIQKSRKTGTAAKRFDQYLVKPVDPKELIRLLNEVKVRKIAKQTSRPPIRKKSEL
ncbi:MAG: response regulator, partial [Candidatus Firestonebacteria bacterium]|nr:response regulator [Candidatus Firestonebacteria bacterium]